jgi:hypothetical protein
MLLGHGHSYLEGIDEELTGHEGDDGAVAAAQWRELLSGGSGRFVGFVGMEIDMRVVRLQRFREGACKGPWAMWAMPCLQTPLEVERCD